MSKVIIKCPTDPNKLLNPLTGRCVIESNVTIRKLLKEGWTVVITPNADQDEPSAKTRIKVFKICPTDPLRLINPETGRCVKHDNRTIKKLMKEGWTIAINKERTLPVLIKTNKISNWKKLKAYLDKNKDSFIGIDEFLSDEEITAQEEMKRQGIFINIYDSENVMAFLEESLKISPTLQKNLCLLTNKTIPLRFGPIKPTIQFYQISEQPLLNYRYFRPLRHAILFNASSPSRHLIIYKNLNDILKKCKNRYLIIPLTLADGNIYEYTQLIRNDKDNHMNILIFDTLNKTVERFDPHGVTKYGRRSPDFITNEAVDKYLKDYFYNHVNEYIYKDVSYTCPYLGPQLKADIRQGYCVTWSVMYTFLRLMNPDTPPGTINRMLIKGTTQELKEKLLRFANYYSEFLKFALNY